MFPAHRGAPLASGGIGGVVMHEPLTNLRKVIFLQFAHGAVRSEIWRGLHGAATLLADCGKICVAVSQDIDPENADAIFWSLAYRSNPIEDVHVAPYRASGHGPKSGRGPEASTLLIGATLQPPSPPLALPARAIMEAGS